MNGDDVDVVVIGGGQSGLAAGYYLRLRRLAGLSDATGAAELAPQRYAPMS